MTVTHPGLGADRDPLRVSAAYRGSQAARRHATRRKPSGPAIRGRDWPRIEVAGLEHPVLAIQKNAREVSVFINYTLKLKQ